MPSADLEKQLREVEERSIRQEERADQKLQEIELHLFQLRSELSHVVEDNKTLKRKAGRNGGGFGGGGSGGTGDDGGPPTTPRGLGPSASEGFEKLNDDSSVALKMREQVSLLNNENTRLTNDFQASERSINARDTRIRELERLLEEARLETAKAVTSSAVAGLDLDAAHETEENELLQSAQDTITRLHRDLRTREEEMRQYQQSLKEVRLRAVEERMVMENEIEALNEKLYSAKNEEVTKLRSAMGKLERGEVVTQVYYDTETGTTNWMKEARAWQETLAEKESTMDTLRRQKAHGEVELEKARTQLQSRVEEIGQLQSEIEDLRNRKPSDKLKKLVKTLRQQLAGKEVQLEHLQGAIEEMREQVTASGLGASRDGGGGGGGDAAKTQELEDRQRKLVSNLKEMKKVIADFKAREKTQKEEVARLQSAAEELELERRNSDRLTSEISRLKSAKRGDKQASAAPAPDARVAELEERIAMLVQSKRQTSPRVKAERDASARGEPAAEKPQTSTRIGSSSPSMAQWEADKRTQKKLERVTHKFTEQKQELAAARSSLEEWRTKAESAAKEADRLKARMLELEKQAATGVHPRLAVAC